MVTANTTHSCGDIYFFGLLSGAGGPAVPSLDPVELVIEEIFGGKDSKHCTVVGVVIQDYTVDVS